MISRYNFIWTYDVFFISNFASNSVICPEYITTISSHPYEIRWGNMRIDFSHPLSTQESYASFEMEMKYCSSNTYAKLRDFVILQNLYVQNVKNYLVGR